MIPATQPCALLAQDLTLVVGADWMSQSALALGLGLNVAARSCRHWGCQEMESGCHATTTLLCAQGSGGGKRMAACAMAWAAPRAWAGQNGETHCGPGKSLLWAVF